MVSAVLLSPRDRRAPGEGQGLGMESWGRRRSPLHRDRLLRRQTGTGSTQTYVKALPAGRRAGRARAVPGGKQKRCTRCTPENHGWATVSSQRCWGPRRRCSKPQGTPHPKQHGLPVAVVGLWPGSRAAPGQQRCASTSAPQPARGGVCSGKVLGWVLGVLGWGLANHGEDQGCLKSMVSPPGVMLQGTPGPLLTSPSSTAMEGGSTKVKVEMTKRW